MNRAVPNHIAIVMDGNGRWATRRFLPRVAGHKSGVDSLRRCVRACAERGVSVLTVFAFSSENWNRPQEEVSGLMELLVMPCPGRYPSWLPMGCACIFGATVRHSRLWCVRVWSVPRRLLRPIPA